MRLATFNVRHAVPPGGRRPDHRTLLAACRDLDADVLALQEVDVRAPRTLLADQPARVARAVGGTAVFVENWGVPGWGRFGSALVVRGRVLRQEVVDLPVAGARPRRALVARIEVGGRRLTVAAAHLDERRLVDEEPPALGQLRALLACLRRHPTPHVLLGDLNLTPARAEPIVVAAGLRRAVAPPTHPADGPARHIDWIAVGEPLEVVAASVPRLGRSDHLPLVATVEVRRRPG